MRKEGDGAREAYLCIFSVEPERIIRWGWVVMEEVWSLPSPLFISDLSNVFVSLTLKNLSPFLSLDGGGEQT